MDEKVIVPREVVAKNGVMAAFGVGGGVALTVLTAIGSGFIPGLIIGGITAVAGFVMYRSALKQEYLGQTSLETSDKRPGQVLLVIGGLVAVAALGDIAVVGFVGKIARFLLGIGKLGLFGWGIFNAVKFFKGLKSRT
ncbi:MAG: hypothetical protein LBU99_06260 [Spirochaetaceae bacterium]|jgi:hypothetical protein|nr:hypothetical protein [Spirochaetaceae bacterium]